MATEVASAYVSIGASTKGLGKAISKEFVGVEREADRTGSRIASTIGGAIKTASKIAVGAVGIVGGVVAGLALKGGFDRALALDNANAKMVALGYSGKEIQSVMDSALNSVKGTAFGLGDAASLASQYLAAGVEQGEALDRALRSAADAAAVANVPLSDVASVFMQLASSDHLYTQDLLQLQQRGLPVFAWLSDSLGKSTGDIREMVSAGEIGFDQLQTAIEENIGGAAKATDSFSASWNNTKAALSRGGAVFAVPGLAVLKDLLDAAIPAIDTMATSLEPLATALFDRIAPGIEWVKDALADFAEGGLDFGSIFDSIDVGSILSGIVPAIRDGLASAADWLATGGIQMLADGFIQGRAAMFDAAMQIIPAVIDAVMQIAPELAGVAVQIVSAIAALAPSIVDTLLTLIPVLLETAITVFMTLVQAAIDVLPVLIETVMTMLPELVATLLDMLPQILTAGVELFSQLIEAVATIVPDLLMVLLTEVLPNVLETVLAMLPELLTTAIDLFFALIDAVLEVLPELIQTLVGDVLPAVLDTLYGMLPELLVAAIGLFMALVDALIRTIPTLVKALGSAIMAILAGIVEAAPKVFASAMDMFLEMGEGLRAAWPEIWEWLKSIPSKISDAFSGAGQWLRDIGGKIISGLIDGLKGAFNRVKDTLGNLTDMLPDWKGPADVDAKLLTGNGRLIMESLIGGFKDGEGAVKRHLEGFTRDLAVTGGASIDVTASGSLGPASSGALTRADLLDFARIIASEFASGAADIADGRADSRNRAASILDRMGAVI